MKIKKKYLKIIFTTLVILLILNFISTVIFASDTTIINDLPETTEEEQQVEDDFNLFGAGVDGIVGVLTYVVKLPLLLIIMGIQGIFTGVAMLGGNADIEGLLTPDDLFFNRVGITNIDFFDFSVGGAVGTIRQNVATWYYIFRILAIVILLGVLIYVGIRMAISTVASEQAQYKRMLTDWLVSFGLIFLLNYIIIFTIEVNNGLIGLLESPVKVKLGKGITTQLVKQSLGIMATKSWGALIVYAMLTGMTVAFLFSYVKRMLTIGFLILISPLITITYSIDKVNDGKAQALNSWLKEFMFNVLIQPFHCIIYIVFISTSIDLLSSHGSLAKMVLAIMCMSFIWKAEKIVKQIFGFGSASSLAETVASFMLVKEIGGKVASAAAKSGSKAASNTTFGRNISNRVANSGVGQKMNNWKNNHPVATQRIKNLGDSYGKMLKGVVVPLGVGAVAAGFEEGANTPANSAHVGLEAFSATRAAMLGNSEADGSKAKIDSTQKELKKYADLIANNNTFNFDNYTNNQHNKDNLKSYAQTLIGTNMDMLNNNIQTALNNLTNSNPGTYNITTAAGMQHLNDLQDMALNDSLDFNDPSTNPVGHAWTQEERSVVTAIQIRNFAQAVQNTHSQYQAAGNNNPSQDISNYIQSL